LNWNGYNTVKNDLKNAIAIGTNEQMLSLVDDNIDGLVEEISTVYSTISHQLSSTFNNSFLRLISIITFILVGNLLLIVLVLIIATLVSRNGTNAINSIFIFIALTKAVAEIKGGNFTTVVPYLAWQDEVGGISR
jgi:hypothetical protein